VINFSDCGLLGVSLVVCFFEFLNFLVEPELEPFFAAVFFLADKPKEDPRTAGQDEGGQKGLELRWWHGDSLNTLMVG